MKQVTTKDNSITFYNEKFDETYHSISGAKEESEKKYIIPAAAKYEELNNIKLKNIETINILDVCFGLSYNTTAAIDFLLNKNPNMKINVIALEYDKEILSKIPTIKIGHKSQKYIIEAIQNSDNPYKYKDKQISIKILIGDGVKTIKTINPTDIKFDFIFHDPFSTTKMPDFWTPEFFGEENRLIKDKPKGILTTYSCARVVKDGLKKTGFTRENVQSIGRRAPSTLAYKE